jgi:nucleoid-associated protein YgaU
MRKDTRIGVAIGLVLFAVLIVYAVVGNKTNGKKKVTLDKTGKTLAPVDEASTRGGAPSTDTGTGTTGSAAGEGQAVADNSNKPTGGTPTATGNSGAGPETLVATDPPAPNGSGANWAALLSATEKVDPVRSRTPDMAPSDNGPASPKPSVAMDGNSKPGRTSRGGESTVAGGTHRVAENETFTSIARSMYGDVRYAEEIRKANPTIDPRRLRPGTVIHLPEKNASGSESATANSRSTRSSAKPAVALSAKEYAVQADDSLYKISVKLYGKADKVDAIYELNKEKIGSDPARLKVGMVLKLPEAPSSVRTASAAR